MESGDVLVVRTGVANLASITAALRRVGLGVQVSTDPAQLANAARVVLPGVGSFAAAMEELHRLHLVSTLVERLSGGRATLAVCLGLQLLGSGSEESSGCQGLAVFEERASRFGSTVRVPQLGWNRISPDPDCTLVQPGSAYFANSFRLTACPAGWRAAWADHGGPFVAALERGAVLACQFHPELSGPWGESLLRRWAVMAEESVPC